MAELITLAIDIALGVLAYRLASENRERIKLLETFRIKTTVAFKKIGINLDEVSEEE